MTVAELIAKLQSLPPDARVVFDTDAGGFDWHLVDIDECWYDPEAYEGVTLGSSAPRCVDWQPRKRNED